MTTTSNHIRRNTMIAAAVLGLVGLGLALSAYTAGREHNRYSVAAEGIVSQRTATYCAVRLQGPISGGAANVEIAYSFLSGTRSDTPPEDGPQFNLGDKVKLVHPPGYPSHARLQDAFAPTVPAWVGWVGVVSVVLAAGLFLVAYRWSLHGRGSA